MAAKMLNDGKMSRTKRLHTVAKSKKGKKSRKSRSLAALGMTASWRSG
jgi:hypothetical protein